MSATETAYVHSVNFNTVNVEGENRKVMNARINIGRSRFNEKTQEYEDTGSIWANLSLWGKSAEHLEDKIEPGVSILTTGRFVTQQWLDSDSGEERTGLNFQADQVALLARSIEKISFRKRSKKQVDDVENNAPISES